MTQRPFQLRSPNRKLESVLQTQCASMLRAYLPDSTFFTASLSGVPLPPAVAAMAKRAGLQRGCPDLMLIFPDAEVRFVELKAEDGVLSKEQKALKLVLGRKMAVCRSWPEVRATIGGWLEARGLAWLTERESLMRESARRDLERKAKARPMRRRAEAVAAQP